MMFSYMTGWIAARAAASGKFMGQLAGQYSNGNNGLFNSPSQLTWVFVAGFFGGLYAFWKGFGVYRDYRMEGDIPQVPVRGAAMGLVHVSGKAEGGETIMSPVSRTPCLFYRLRVERPKERSAMWQYNRAFSVFGLMDSVGIGSSVRWETEKVVDNGSVFHLDDGTGKVAVDLHGAEFLVQQSGQCEMDPVSADAAAGGWGGIVAPGAHGGEGRPARRARGEMDGDGKSSHERWAALRHAIIGPLLAAKLLGLVLLSFLSILLLSNVITALSSFFLAKDLDLLACSPVDWLDLYLAKLGETLLHSSWMVALMAVPIFSAYGIIYHGGWLFPLHAIAAFAPMLILPAVVGSAVTLILVNVFPARRTRGLYPGPRSGTDHRRTDHRRRCRACGTHPVQPGTCLLLHRAGMRRAPQHSAHQLDHP